MQFAVCNIYRLIDHFIIVILIRKIPFLKPNKRIYFSLSDEMLHCSFENHQQFLQLYGIPNSKEVVPYWNLNVLEMIYLKESLRWVHLYLFRFQGARSPLQSIIIR